MYVLDCSKAYNILIINDILARYCSTRVLSRVGQSTAFQLSERTNKIKTFMQMYTVTQLRMGIHTRLSTRIFSLGRGAFIYLQVEVILKQ